MPFTGSEPQAANGVATLIDKIGTLAFEGMQLAIREWKIYKDEARLNVIQKINGVFDDHLKILTIQENNNDKPVKLPPIFKLADESEQTESPESSTSTPRQDKRKGYKYQSFVMSKELIRSIKNKKPQVNSVTMRKYIHHITEAINTMLDYHAQRITKNSNKADDTTSNVICYILLMLSEHCLNFRGTEKDKEYVDRLGRFVNGFASLRGQDSDRFKWLSIVYKSIRDAADELKEHLSVHYADDLNNQLISGCDDTIPALIRCYVKLVTPLSHWPYVETVPLQNLSSGILREKFESSYFSRSDKSINMPDNMISKWAQRNASDLLLAQGERPKANPHQKLELKSNKFELKEFNDFKANDLTERNKLTHFFNTNTYTSGYNKDKEKKVNPELSKIKKESARQLKAIAEYAFNTNFKTFYDLARLNDLLISLRFFCLNLYECSKHEGENYLKDTAASKYIFDDVLEGLKTLISHRVKDVQIAMSKFIAATKDQMLVAEKQQLLSSIEDKLVEVNHNILVVCENMIKAHKQNAKPKGNTSSPYVNGLITETLYLKDKPYLKPFHKIARGYLIDVSQAVTEEGLDDSKQDNHIRRISVSGLSPIEPATPISEYSGSHTPIETSTDSPPTYPYNETVNRSSVTDSHTISTFVIPRKSAAPTLEEQVKSQIHNIEKNDHNANPKEMKLYRSILSGTQKFKAHADSLLTSSDPERQSKGHDILSLKNRILSQTLNQLLSENRSKNVSKFCKKMSDELSDKNNLFLDVHKNTVTQGAQGLTQILLAIATFPFYLCYKYGSFFQTTSRLIAKDLKNNIMKQTKEASRKYIKPI
jgi:hypothetical protein